MIQSRQIEAFRAVMLQGGMTAAAKMINVSQPAVSRLIRDLEVELGFLLFERRGNLVTPTAQADTLFAEVERSFIGLQHIRDFAKDVQTGRGGMLRVAALPAMSVFLPRFVARFMRERPRLNVFVDSLPSPAIREQVAAGQLDIGVTASPFKLAALTATPIEDNAVVAVPSTHRLSRKPWVEAQDLQGEKLVLLTKFSGGMRHPVELALQDVRLETDVLTPLSAVACAFVSEGAGVAIVDPFSASEFVGKGVALRPFKPLLLIGTAVVHSSERPLSPVAEEYHAAFVAHAKDLARQAGNGLPGVDDVEKCTGC